jgi:LmbE family N-acetylglucosaminyl deacetylase
MLRRIKLVIIIVLLLIVAFLLYFFGKEYIINYFYKTYLKDFPSPPKTSRILIIAPHCDDETLGTGELISRMSKQGAEIKIILMTNGDGFTDALDISFHEIRPRGRDYIKFGYLRQGETLKAMEYIGLDRKHIIFLGYPDGGLYDLWSVNHWFVPHESIHTRRNSSPYNNSYTPNAAYTGYSVVRDLEKIIGSFQPDYVFMPHPNDRHPDHLASYCFTKYVLNRLNTPAHEYYYLVHRGDWPVMIPNPQKSYLVPPHTLVNNYTTWFAYNLPDDEVKQKRKAILKYSTQIRIMGPRLMAFDRRNELFSFLGNGVIHKVQSNVQGQGFRDYLLVSDPTSDVLLSTIRGSGDLDSLYGYIDASENLKLFLEAKHNLGKGIKYSVDLILYSSSAEEYRFSINAENKSSSIILMQHESMVSSIRDIGISTWGRVLEITIPSKYISGIDRCFIGAASGFLDLRLDNMAWRMYEMGQ